MSDTLVWTCSVCSGPIFDNRGYLECSYEDIRAGGPIPWTSCHDACRADDGYSVSVEQVRHASGVLEWTLHLSRKSWYARSDWSAVMAAHGVDVTGIDRPAPAMGSTGWREAMGGAS